ncbi:hypothetical protein [Hydrogenophaga sp.]|uniref:hypothetical protein n=1 Tax=Hydrogenophaga sp. TaxID=1904254 RepID=UPI002FCBE561
MSLWLPERLKRTARMHAIVGLDAHGMAWLCNEAATTAPRQADITELAKHLVPGARVDVIVAVDVAVHWLQTPPAGVNSLPELRQIAATRCAHLFGGVPAGWWVAGDWSATQAFVCAGLPIERVGPLQHALAAAGTQTRWHTAWGLLCQARGGRLPADGWSAVSGAGGVVLWCCQRGRVIGLASLTVDTQADRATAQAAVAQHLRIECLRDPTLALGPVHWADLPMPADTMPHSGAALALALAPLLSKALP